VARLNLASLVDFPPLSWSCVADLSPLTKLPPPRPKTRPPTRRARRNPVRPPSDSTPLTGKCPPLTQDDFTRLCASMPPLKTARPRPLQRPPKAKGPALRPKKPSVPRHNPPRTRALPINLVVSRAPTVVVQRRAPSLLLDLVLPLAGYDTGAVQPVGVDRSVQTDLVFSQPITGLPTAVLLYQP